jgi:hypothetical protein
MKKWDKGMVGFLFISNNFMVLTSSRPVGNNDPSRGFGSPSSKKVPIENSLLGPIMPPFPG